MHLAKISWASRCKRWGQNHRVNHCGNQVGGNLNAVELPQAPGDLPRRHAPRVHRHDLFVEAGKAALVFADQRRMDVLFQSRGMDRTIEPTSVSTILWP